MSSKRNILFIDTANLDRTEVKLSTSAGEVIKTKLGRQKSLDLLPFIDRVLRENKLKLTDLDEVRVNCGPGSFTGVRVGVTVANTLAWVLGIPVNGQKQVKTKYARSKFD